MPGHITPGSLTITPLSGPRVQQPKMVPISSPADLAACKADLATKRHCQIGDIIVVDVTGTVSATGRCERDPKPKDLNDPKQLSYAISNNTFSRVLDEPQKACPT